MVLRFESALASHVGMVRSNNQDSGYAGNRLFFVADGMGGHAGGDVASAIIAREVATIDDQEFPSAREAAHSLSDQLLHANRSIAETVKRRPELAGMGSTFSGFYVADQKFGLAHIGDSRIYRLRKQKLRQLTKDHTFVQKLVDSGRITEEEAATHPRRSVLMRVLGDVESYPDIDTEVLDPQAGDLWLLCSDGLCGYVEEKVIEAEMRRKRPLQATVDALIDSALENGAPDNVTVVLVAVHEVPPDRVAAAELPAPAPAGEPASRATAADLAADLTADRAVDPADSPSVDPAVAPPAATSADAPAATGDPSAATGDAPAEAVDGTPAAETTDTETTADDTHGVASTDTAAAEPERDEWGFPLQGHRFVGSAADEQHAAAITPPSQNGRLRSLLSRRKKAQPVEESRLEPRVDEYLAELIAETRRRNWRRRGMWALGGFLAAIVLAAIAFIGYQWTQSQYYVGTDGESVIIYRGVQQDLGPIRLHSEAENTGIPLDALEGFEQRQVKRTIPTGSLADARDLVLRLGEQAGSDAGSDASGEAGSDASGDAGSPEPGTTNADLEEGTP